MRDRRVRSIPSVSQKLAAQPTNASRWLTVPRPPDAALPMTLRGNPAHRLRVSYAWLRRSAKS